MNKLIIVSAPSGAGKTTLVKELMKNEDLNLMFSISATSREPRKNEKDEKDYYFLSISEFKEQIEKNDFIEWEEVYKNQYYGTLRSEINRIWGLNKNIIFDVDVKGGLNIKKNYPKNSLSIFVKPPSIEELKNRLQKRGSESIESLKKRIQKAEYEMSFASNFDIVIINDNLEEAINEIYKKTKDFLE